MLESVLYWQVSSVKGHHSLAIHLPGMLKQFWFISKQICLIIIVKYSDKDLTLKLTVLMALSSASRVSSLEHLYIKFLARNDMSYKFYFHKLHKSQRWGKAPPTPSYHAYTQDPNLCVAKTLDKYISRTEGWRSEEECSQSLLNFVNPHKPVVYSTISGWLKNVLKKARVGISTRSAFNQIRIYF